MNIAVTIERTFYQLQRKRFANSQGDDSAAFASSGQTTTQSSGGQGKGGSRLKVRLTMDIAQYVFELLGRILQGSQAAEKELMRLLAEHAHTSSIVNRVVSHLVKASQDNNYAKQFLQTLYTKGAFKEVISRICLSSGPSGETLLNELSKTCSNLQKTGKEQLVKERLHSHIPHPFSTRLRPLRSI